MIQKDIVTHAKPFLKWAGGKTKLLPILLNHVPYNITNFAEPFLGGGAFAFELLNKYSFDNIILSDINTNLITTYRIIKENVNDVITKLTMLERLYKSYDTWESRSDIYYQVRDLYNSNPANDIELAACFIFLNHTCYNGLYRVNSANKFNVPHGKYKNPTICDENNLREVSNVLQNVTLRVADYHDVLTYANNSWLCYFDPPYKPISKTASFTSYTAEQFHDKDQEELANVLKQLDNKSVNILLSNSDLHNTDINNNYFDNLYKDFTIERIPNKHTIGRNASSRKSLNELLIYNYNISHNIL